MNRENCSPPNVDPTSSSEQVKEISIKDLQPFRDHPFKVLNNEDMDEITESIGKYGVLTPALVRPLPQGGYELISGHRRTAACKKLGIEKIPAVVREMTDDEAVIAMVDANLQRKNILPSEKAYAYKMKMERLNHQGTSRHVGTKSRSDEFLADQSSDSARQIQRYIRLTNLIPDILQKVDEGQIALTPAVELSYLSKEEQQILAEAMEYEDCTPSLSQAVKLKKLSQSRALKPEDIAEIMSQPKANQQDKISFRTEEIRKFFPKNYDTLKMQQTILKLLHDYQKRRQREQSR